MTGYTDSQLEIKVVDNQTLNSMVEELAFAIH
jgi:hypothetical protein